MKKRQKKEKRRVGGLGTRGIKRSFSFADLCGKKREIDTRITVKKKGKTAGVAPFKEKIFCFLCS